MLLERARFDRGGGVRARELAGLAFCLVTAAAVLMICSMNSFLYPLNRWDDVNCFVTVARGMLKGMLPYRDLAEQKGPLLYALHAAALWVFPNSYHGIYIIEVLLMTASLYLVWRILRLYDRALCAAWMAPLAAMLCLSASFRLGDSAEELCLPFILASMYAALRSFRTGKPVSMRGCAAHGALAGCVLWIKFNQLGPHFVFMATLAILAVIDDRRLGRALGMCGMFLLGMALASAPWFAIFGARGAIGDMLRVYIYENVFGYVNHRYPLIVQVGVSMVRSMLQNPLMSVAMLVGLACLLAAPKDRMSPREKLYLILSAAFTAVLIYGGGRRHSYYFLAFAPFAAFGLLAVGRIRALLCRKRPERPGAGARRGLAAAMCAAFLLGSTGFARVTYHDAQYIGLPWENTPQGMIGAYIREREDRTLLNLNFLDGGFYTAADVLPVNYYFCRLNNYEERAMADQLAVVAEGRVNFVVTHGETLEEIIDGAREAWPETVPEAFAAEYTLAMQAYNYRLYERVPAGT